MMPQLLVDEHDSRQEIARTFLALAARTFSESKAHRPYYAKLAHEAGLTHAEIGGVYGVTEAAVRHMIKRATPTPECAGCMDSVQPGHTCPECGLYDPNEAF